MNQKKYGVVLSYLNIFVKNGVNFLYVPFLLRYVGQADYGLFQMTNSTIMSLSLLSLGFSSAYIKFFMNYKYANNSEENIKKLNGFYLLLFCIISLLSLVIGYLLVINTQNIFGNSLNAEELITTKNLMLMLVINVAISFPSSVFDSYILANERFIFQQIRQIMQSLLVPLIAIPLIVLGYGILSIAIIQVCVSFLFLVMNIKFCLKKLHMKFEFSNIPKKFINDIGMFSFFIFLTQIVDMINNNVPNFILGIMLGSKEVATFAIALQIKNIFFMLSVSLSSIFVPTVNMLVSKNTDKNTLTDLMIKLGRYQMIILFYILGGFIVVGRFFITKWAGTQNELSYYLVILMVIPSLIPLSQNIGIEIQKAYNKHIFRSIVYIIFAFLNILITILGTKYLGLMGTSLGYVFTLICANGLLMNWYYHNKIGLNMKKYWLETLNSTIPFLLTVPILLLLETNIPITNYFRFAMMIVIYSLLYVVLLYLFTISKDEKENLKIRFN